ncbi:MAG: prepilin-type N-terminal cleavage/methylation domain-containing protein [Lachnospiraceae bacterium]|nr:prepilin-type N-terminal cleavage/methylation domain-containing protein [Candidatus Merdinaster equi]
MDKISRDNKGLSLVELIAAIAIMGILGMSVFFGMQLVAGHAGKEMAKTVESLTQKSRTYCMGRREAKVEFNFDATSGWSAKETFTNVKSGTTDVETTEYTTTNIGEADVKVFDVSSGSETQLSAFSFEFNRSDGSLRNYNGSPATKNVVIEIRNGGKTYQLKIERMTGKINVDAIN